MKVFISRYVVPYLLLMFMNVLGLCSVAYFFDGLVVFLSVILSVILAVGTIPFMIYQDYRTVMKYVNNAREAHKAGNLRENVFETAGEFASMVSGVPSFIVDPIIRKVNAKFPSQKAA